jgi:hypothetical protein
VNAQRLTNFRAALAFLRLPPTEPELQLLHRRGSDDQDAQVATRL